MNRHFSLTNSCAFVLAASATLLIGCDAESLLKERIEVATEVGAKCAQLDHYSSLAGRFNSVRAITSDVLSCIDSRLQAYKSLPAFNVKPGPRVKEIRDIVNDAQAQLTVTKNRIAALRDRFKGLCSERTKCATSLLSFSGELKMDIDSIRVAMTDLEKLGERLSALADRGESRLLFQDIGDDQLRLWKVMGKELSNLGTIGSALSHRLSHVDLSSISSEVVQFVGLKVADKTIDVVEAQLTFLETSLKRLDEQLYGAVSLSKLMLEPRIQDGLRNLISRATTDHDAIGLDNGLVRTSLAAAACERIGTKDIYSQEGYVVPLVRVALIRSISIDPTKSIKSTEVQAIPELLGCLSGAGVKTTWKQLNDELNAISAAQTDLLQICENANRPGIDGKPGAFRCARQPSGLQLQMMPLKPYAQQAWLDADMGSWLIRLGQDLGTRGDIYEARVTAYGSADEQCTTIPSDKRAKLTPGPDVLLVEYPEDGAGCITKAKFSGKGASVCEEGLAAGCPALPLTAKSDCAAQCLDERAGRSNGILPLFRAATAANLLESSSDGKILVRSVVLKPAAHGVAVASDEERKIVIEIGHAKRGANSDVAVELEAVSK